MTFGGCKVDVWGRGPHSNYVLDFISAPTIARTADVHEIDSTSKKVSLWFIAHELVRWAPVTAKTEMNLLIHLCRALQL